MEPEILCSGNKRAIRWPGIAAGCVRPGTIGERDGAGMGDALVMDLRKGLFAVSDSSTRNPAASRNLLWAFSEKVGSDCGLDPGKALPRDDFERIRPRLVEASEQVLQKIPYTESCTFTGVLVANTEAGTRGILWHMGDSLLVEVNPRTGEGKRLTTSNFWMAGRSRRFFQVQDLAIPPEALLILATDGVSDLRCPAGSNTEVFLVEQVACHPIEEIPNRIVEAIDGQGTQTDDLAVICLCPARVVSLDRRIVLGGIGHDDETGCVGKGSPPFGR